METMIVVGVDGCRAGWIAAGIAADGAISIDVFTEFCDLLQAWKDADRILVDIPIGLPSRANPSRTCDVLARRHLQRRASSVFSPPCRRAARAAFIPEAREENLREVDRSLSAQAWGICKKITEVDQVLLNDRDARRRVMEVHPEICFWALNGAPMKYPKRAALGKQERLELLQRWEPRTAEVLRSVMARYTRSDVQPDDVLDALVALVTARAEDHQLRSLPEQPSVDEYGLPMRMVYRDVALDVR